jgi:hypothetical protein
MNGFGNPLTEYSPQMETFEYPQGEEEFTGESAGVFNETQEMELASELLEVANEEELDHFLGDLIKKAGNAVGKFVSSPAGQAIGGVLKSAAKTALPIAGGALGAYFGGPLGAQIGSNLAGMAGQALGLELEGLSQEDQEYEAARQFVRFAGETAKNTLTAPQGGDPAALARAAAAEAARIHAPGLLGPLAIQGRSGQWVRHGNRIVLYGI